MIDINVMELLPAFLLADQTGHAMAKAFEAGIKYMLKTVEYGVDCIMDVEKMPEWRLDEMAYETNCLYDYGADVEQKRAWIRDAMPMYRFYGTPYAVRRYLDDAFKEVRVLENWEYGGDPYHFRIEIRDDWSKTREDWVIKSVETLKNLRSANDAIHFVQERTQKLYFGHAVLEQQKTSMQMWTEPFPTEDALVDENRVQLMDDYGRLMYAETSSLTDIIKKYFVSGMNTAGDVFDQFDIERGVAVRRIGVADASLVQVNKYDVTEGTLYRVEIVDIKPIASTSIVPNAKCERYVTTSKSKRHEGSLSQQASGMKALDIIDSSYATVDDFKAGMAGVPIFYELETPVETVIEAKDLEYLRLIDDGNDETISLLDTIILDEGIVE